MLYDRRKEHSGRPSFFTDSEYKQVELKLKDPRNGFVGYKDLQAWIEAEFEKKISYANLNYYGRTYFGASVKVARKSHVKKEEAAVEALKKLL